MRARPRLLLHVEALWGIGHLVRALRLLGALTASFDCAVVSGSPGFDVLALPVGVRRYRLPAVAYTDDCDALVADGAPVARVLAERSAGVLRALVDFAPDVLVVEMFPFGRHVLRDELLLALEFAAARGAPVAVSVRDVCTYPSDPARREGYTSLVRQVFGAYCPLVLVHSDAAVQPVDDSVPTDMRPTGAEFVQTGYVGRSHVFRSRRPRAVVRVTASGGSRGVELLRRTAGMLGQLAPASAVRVSVGLGVHDGARATLAHRAGAAAKVGHFEPSLAFGTLAHVAGWIVAGGYNTWMDVLATRVPTVVVPLDEEQALRTRRLAIACPWVQSVQLTDPDAAWIEAWRAASVERPRARRRADTAGASRAAQLLAARVT